MSTPAGLAIWSSAGVARPHHPRAPGTPHELPPGERHDVAPDLVDVDGELPDGLARVELIEDRRVAEDRTDSRRRVDQPTLGGHVRQRHQPGSLVQHRLQRGHVDLTLLVVGHHRDLDTLDLRCPEQAAHVARVFALRREDPITGLETQRGERGIPAPRGRLDERPVLGPTTAQRRGVVIHRLERLGPVVGHLVAAALGLGPQVPDHGLDHHRGREARTGVVEMDDGCATRRVGPSRIDVDAHGADATSDAPTRSTTSSVITAAGARSPGQR